MANVFKGLSLAGEQNTCMSFFPVKIELNSGECKHVCLVTTSGDVYKVGNEKNKEALVAFQKNLKRLAEKIPAQMIDKIYYEFIYHDAENGSIDVLLQQVNKGLSGQEQPLSSIKEETKIVLNDPFRACAEKKFIAYIRDCLKNPNIKSLKILGASNLRMPIIPTINHQELLDEKIKEFCQFVKTNCKDISNERMLTEVKEKIKDESEKAEKFISEQSAALLASYKKATEFVMAVYPKKWNGKNIGADLLKILARCDELLASPQEKRKVREILQQHFSFMLELHTKWIEFLELEKEESETIENSENIATFEEKKLESQTCIKKYINDMKEKITDNISKLPVNERFKNQQEFNKESEMLNNAIDRLGKKLVTIDQLIVQFKQSLKSINKKIETPNELVFLVTRSDKDNFELSSSFINCCNACVANKLPVLTWLTDLQEQKQTRLTTEVSTMVTTTTTTASRNGSADNSPSKLLATKMVKSLNISKVNNESPLKSTSPDKSKPALLLSQSPFQQSAFSPLNSCSSMNMGGKEGRKGIARQLFRKDEEPTSTEHSQLNQKK